MKCEGEVTRINTIGISYGIQHEENGSLFRKNAHHERNQNEGH